MPGNFLFRGFLIGIMFGLPAGVVGMMAVQRTLNHGVKAGLITGLGSSVADCLYSAVGAFGLTLISDFLLEWQWVVNALGGTLIFLMGIRIVMQKNKEMEHQFLNKDGIKMFLTALGVGISNPAAILTFLFAFSYFEIPGQMGRLQAMQLVVGVFFGTYFWWGTLAMAVNAWREKAKREDFRKLDQIFGVMLMGFGAFIWIRML